MLKTGIEAICLRPAPGIPLRLCLARLSTAYSTCELHTTCVKFRTPFEFLVALCASGCECKFHVNVLRIKIVFFLLSNEIIWISYVLVVIYKVDNGIDDNDRTGCWWSSFGGFCTRRRTSMCWLSLKSSVVFRLQLIQRWRLSCTNNEGDLFRQAFKF